MSGAAGGGRWRLPLGPGGLLVAAATLASLLLIGAYLAAGGASYTPQEIRDPCEPRPWSDPRSLAELANQFSSSALDGAACELGVSRERLARALADERARERFARRLGIDDARLAEAIRAGLLRAVDDAEEAGALSPLVGVPLRSTLERIPLEQAIELLRDGRTLFEDVRDFLGPAGGLLERLLP